jgi:hypothetical protein
MLLRQGVPLTLTERFYLWVSGVGNVTRGQDAQRTPSWRIAREIKIVEFEAQLFLASHINFVIKMLKI